MHNSQSGNLSYCKTKSFTAIQLRAFSGTIPLQKLTCENNFQGQTHHTINMMEARHLNLVENLISESVLRYFCLPAHGMNLRRGSSLIFGGFIDITPTISQRMQ